MKFVNHADIKRPAETVFAFVTNFPAFETRARTAGISVERLAGDARPVPGSTWKVKGVMAGGERDVEIRLAQINAPTRLLFENSVKGAEMTFEIQISPLSPKETRLRTIFEVKARSLGVRLMIQSMRLIRPRLNARIDTGLRQAVARIEAETA